MILNVADLEETISFYRDVLGLRVTDTWDDGADGPGCILEVGPGRTIEFFGPPFGARKDKRLRAGTELSFEVEDADAWLQRLTDAGVPIAREMLHNPWGDRSFGIDDPEGMRIWILEDTSE